MADTTLKLLLLGEDRSASKAISGVGDSAAKSEGKVHKLSKAAGVALAAGLAAATAAAVKFTNQAADDSEAATKLALSLQKNAGATKSQVAAVEDWITAQGKATGITDDELRPALQKLVAVTGDVSKSQNMAMLAQDVAAGTGKSYTSIVDALVRAQNGQVAGLSRLGVQTKDAEGKTMSLNDITKQLAQTYGGQAAAAAETTAGKQKILSTQMSELGESIGYTLLPYMEKLVDWMTKAVDWVDRNRTTAALLVGGIVALVAAVAAINGVMAVYNALMAVATIRTAMATEGTVAYAIASKVTAAASKAWAVAQWALNAALTANPIGIIIALIAALVVGFIVAYKKSDTFKKIVDAALRGIGVAAKWMWNNAIKPAFAAFMAGIKAVGKVGQWLWNNVFKPVFKLIIGGVAMLLEMWAKMLRALSHVPGFGWAKGAADAMDKAAGKARDLQRAIEGIKPYKKVTIEIRTIRTGNDGAGGPRDPGAAGKVQLGGSGSSTGDGLSSGSGDLGTVTLELRGESGAVIQRKLLKLKREKGLLKLGLA